MLDETGGRCCRCALALRMAAQGIETKRVVDEFALPQDPSLRAADQHGDVGCGGTRLTLRSFIEAYRELTAIDRDVMLPPARSENSL